MNEKLKYQQFYNYIAGLSEVPMGYLPGGTLSIDEAFNVYADGYRARLTEALCETYETIHKFAGDEVFFEVCEDYIKKNPSVSYNLNDYGATFPEYLNALPAQKDYPFLYDLAVLDRNRSFMFHQKSELGIGTAEVQGNLKENSVLSFVASMMYTKSDFDIVRIWKELNRHEFRVENLEEYQKPTTTLLFKDGEATKVFTLSANSFTALYDLNRGLELTTALANLEPDQVTELFKNLMTYQLIRNVA